VVNAGYGGERTGAEGCGAVLYLAARCTVHRVRGEEKGVRRQRIGRAGQRGYVADRRCHALDTRARRLQRESERDSSVVWPPARCLPDRRDAASAIAFTGWVEAVTACVSEVVACCGKGI
jgi:hypothetical protein